uniref:Putative secreted protein n=1 Tax=Anopheles marajoara TaxID=58244 RepID=A0A2M4C704_9DIPT
MAPRFMLRTWDGTCWLLFGLNAVPLVSSRPAAVKQHIVQYRNRNSRASTPPPGIVSRSTQDRASSAGARTRVYDVGKPVCGHLVLCMRPHWGKPMESDATDQRHKTVLAGKMCPAANQLGGKE